MNEPEYVQAGGADDLPVWIYRAVRAKNREMHRHKFMEIAMLVKGTCVHRCSGEQNVLLPGDLFIIYPDVSHAIDMTRETVIYNILIRVENSLPEIDEAFANPLIHAMIWPEAQPHAYPLYHISAKQREEVLLLLRRIEGEYIDKRTNYRENIHAYLWLLLTALARMVSSPDGRYIGLRDNMAMLLEYIEENYANAIHPAQLAQLAHMSESHLYRVFKEHMGISPVQYLNRVRMQKAEAFLEQEGASVSEAAERVGMLDVSHFSKLFKSVNGYPPSRVRAKK